MQRLNINDMFDINALFKKFVGDILENRLEGKLGYNKYDWRNKGTDNSCNGQTTKTSETGFSEVDIDVPCDRKGEYEPLLVKRQQTTVDEKIHVRQRHNPGY